MLLLSVIEVIHTQDILEKVIKLLLYFGRVYLRLKTLDRLSTMRFVFR
jgi:hypothetical protein